MLSICLSILGGLIVKDAAHEQIRFIVFQLFLQAHLLNFWSVVRVASGKINFIPLPCREFNLFFGASLQPSHRTDA